MPCKHLQAVYFLELKGKQVHSQSSTFGLYCHKPNNFVNLLYLEVFLYTANVYRQTTDKLMFKSVISTVR